ncbi:IPT/TIG domain-containing protein [Streptomyces sp. NPDC058650]|uniref:IPT/TIG domain-containing protein n=1 Tax=Streptomyces sp. NPDC058650 TaxID=3346575 RepID=UPI003652FED4
MADQTMYNTTVPSQGSVALAHERIIRVKRNGVFENITGDVNNLLDTPTPVTVQREVYGTKGTQSSDIIGYNHVITFAVEAVRNAAGAIVQPWLIALLNAAAAKGASNKVEVQVFDARDDAVPSFQGTFSVSQVPGNTGYADKLVINFTLTSDGVVNLITSPIAGTLVPVLESATPTLQAPGDLIVVRGYKLASTVSATIKAIAVVELRVVDDNTVVLLIPATVTGSSPIIVTNAAGASTALPYTAA